jgi:hypothetical protein
MILSEEQQDIVNDVRDGFNVIVSAVAGSGKTTTIFQCLKKLPASINALCLTFSKGLRSDSVERLKILSESEDPIQCEAHIHTLHSFAYKYYGKECGTNLGIVLSKKLQPQKLPSIDLIILDEAQDFNETIFRFIHVISGHIAHRAQKAPQFLILGDPKQCVRSYDGADSRFLTFADQIMPYRLNREWKRRTLSVSYRIPSTISDFLNECVLQDHEQKIQSVPRDPKDDGDRVQYIVGGSFRAARQVARDICDRIKKKTLKPEDVFILANSMNGRNTPAAKMNEIFDSNCIPVYCQKQGETETPKDVKAMKGRLVMGTNIFSKGLERLLVVVLGFNASYFRFCARNADSSICPDHFHVAMTRAKRTLIIIAEEQDGEHMPFLHIDQLNTYADVIRVSEGKNAEKCDENQNLQQIAVHNLLRHLPSSFSSRLRDLLTFELVSEAGTNVEMPSEIEGKFGAEAVSDINGLAIPAIYEVYVKGKSTISQFIGDMRSANHINENPVVTVAARIIDAQKTTESRELATACAYSAFQSGMLTHITQLPPTCDWLTKQHAFACIENILPYVSECDKFEFPLKSEVCISRPVGAIPYTGMEKLPSRVQINGSVDILGQHLIEVKCVTQLTDCNFLQLACYVYLLHMRQTSIMPTSGTLQLKPTDYLLVNALSGEAWKLTSSVSECAAVVQELLWHKFVKDGKISNQQFLDTFCSIAPCKFEPRLSIFEMLHGTKRLRDD